MMMTDQKYWNPILETLPQENIREFQFKKFRRIFEWAYTHSKFHRSLYDKAGLKPDDIRSMDDVRHIPKVEKSMMRDIQRKDPFPYGDALCVPLEEVVIFRQTSGTTGQPVYQPDTWQDWDWWAECWAFILWAQGYRPSDRVFIPFGYNIFVAFWAGHYAAEKLGCEVIPGGVLDTKARILKIQELKATAMMATPTYVLGMADTARAKMDIDPSSLTINKITCAGEPGASIPTTKKRMEEAWGAKVYDHAGATEIGAWSFECTEPGKRGKMIITALDRRAMPCVRFDSKDIIEWSPEPCPCGRTFRILKGGIVGRADDITKVKGVLLAPSAIEEVVRGTIGLSDEFEVVVDKMGDVDRITLKIELLPDAADQKETIQRQLTDQLRLKTNLGYKLEFHEYGTLPRYEVKAKRFRDLRKDH
jgi:phenylacetate-CoA ligase